MARLSIEALAARSSVGAPLRERVFRRIWLASLLSNLGLLIQGVGSAWAMTEMTASADMVALVQTALMAPVMFTALGAGALADMYDRRIVSIIALSISIGGATAMTALSFAGLINPPLLLALCFTVGTGMALFGPAWQASVSEQVPAEVLPQAVALNSISYNIARSFGPAVGGIIVAALGAVAAFLANAVLYLPLLWVLYRWRREREPSRLPPEGLSRAMVSGVRYLAYSPSIRTILTRGLLIALAGGSVSALMPLVARTMLHGGAMTYGVMLGSFGLGAIAGALNVARIRERMEAETLVRLSVLLMGAATLVVSFSPWAVLTAVALVAAGACWMVTVTVLNISVQLSIPRWVAGRALAAFQAAIAGGIGVGSWIWGAVAEHSGVAEALTIAGVTLMLLPILGIWLRIPSAAQSNAAASNVLEDPDVRLALTGRSGPIVVEIQYEVDPARAREFHGVMQKVQLIRQRNGAYGWSIARDIAQPQLWTERFHYPTWHDFLRNRNRPTQAERDIQASAVAFHIGAEPVRVSRMLERPFGSVRWKETTPDRAVDVMPVTGH